MPARPEYRRAGGCEWVVEIFGHGDSQHLGCADHDVRVACEVEEKLQAIAECKAPDVSAAPMGDAIEARADAVTGENSLAHQFGELHHQDSGGDALKAAGDIV